MSEEIKTFTEFMRDYPYASGNATQWCWDAWIARNPEVESLKKKIAEIDQQNSHQHDIILSMVLQIQELKNENK